MLTPANMDSSSIAPLTQDDVIQLLSDVTIGDLYAAESPFDVLTTAGMTLLHPITTSHGEALIRFAFVHAPGWGWIPIGFGPSLRKAHDRDTNTETWENSTDRFGMLVKGLTKPLVGVTADITGVLMRMADIIDDKRVYNDGYWSPITHHLMLTMQHLKQVDPDQFAATQTLIGLAHPHALIMMERLGVWLDNDTPELRADAEQRLGTVAEDTWPSFITGDDSEVTDSEIVEHFLASIEHTEWTDRSVQRYLREESRITESPVRRALLSEYQRNGDFLPYYGNDTGDLNKVNLDDYDFFLHPERRKELGARLDEAAMLDRLYEFA